ncbi:MAG: PFL_4669 family integrating conjugative element protein [Candidatus Porifericomitaceae bacterium WSBS_2022_MAG_OTU9]
MQEKATSRQIKSTPLRSASKLALMSVQAQRLVYGRQMKSGEKNATAPIVGLFNFASLLRMIWLGARQDDPYADLWLIRIHQALQDGGQGLLHMHSMLDDLLKKIPEGIEVRLAETQSPMEVDLRFSTPYAFTGAYFLCGYDKYIRKVLTARHVGILSWTGANSEQKRAGKLVRRTFLSATGYRFTGVTRTDIANNTTRAIFAARQMGMVPKSILEGGERAPYAPLVRGNGTTAETPDVGAGESEEKPRDTEQSG